MTSARIPEEDACHHARNLCVFPRVQKGTPRLTHKGCIWPRVSLGALISDVTVILGMRQSIHNIGRVLTSLQGDLSSLPSPQKSQRRAHGLRVDHLDSFLVLCRVLACQVLTTTQQSYIAVAGLHDLGHVEFEIHECF